LSGEQRLAADVGWTPFKAAQGFAAGSCLRPACGQVGYGRLVVRRSLCRPGPASGDSPDRASPRRDQGDVLVQRRVPLVDSGVRAYFCDPRNPWQHGTNENTNGLLRQYLPKSSDLRRFDQAALDAIAAKLIGRPRQTLVHWWHWARHRFLFLGRRSSPGQLPAIGRLRSRVGWRGRLRLGRACQHRPARSLHPGRGGRARLPPRRPLEICPRLGSVGGHGVGRASWSSSGAMGQPSRMLTGSGRPLGRRGPMLGAIT
jgi:hypothetical protein